MAKGRRKKGKRIVGVDGEGQDFYICHRCGARGNQGERCPASKAGELHVFTHRCVKCEKYDPAAGTACLRRELDGRMVEYPEHEREIVADGHIYTYLAAVDEHGKPIAEVYNGDGLTHDESVEMLLRIPKTCLPFGFMFSYDVCKIVEEMPANIRYYLLRPNAREVATCKNKDCKEELPRAAKKCHVCGSTKIRKSTRPIEYNGRSYDFFNGSLTITAMVDGRERSVKVWDCFRFFGCAFVEALKSWSTCKTKDCDDGASSPGLSERLADGSFKCTVCAAVVPDDDRAPVATKSEIAQILSMKLKRGAFDVEDPDDVRRYCRSECHLLARKMRRLVDAHERAGIPLKHFYGAGSTASALLNVHGVAEFKGTRHRDLDPGLAEAIEKAFFGGRFEDSVVGLVKQPVHGYDISSAYPFAETSLPCLECGRWRFGERMTQDKMELFVKKGSLVLAKFRVKQVTPEVRKEIAWCPLPFRSEEGSITYGTNFGGWAWAPELLAALRGWPDLVELDGRAWVYDRRCEHQPFSFIPLVYRQRNEWGKEGAGIVLKLGMNASYGKTAQSIGENPPFQSWIWAGMTTATTRGQLLDAIASAKDRWNVLAVATDGIFGLEELPLKAPPWETGTGDMKKPLGGWEHKSVPEGIFLAKPGLYYSLEQKFIRARGVGRREVKEFHALLEAGFAAWDRRDPAHHVALKSRRFYGAKHSIYGRSACARCQRSWAGVPEQLCPRCGCVGTSFETQMILTERGREAYGTWDARTVKIAFDPYPKREREGVSRRGPYARLHIRDLEGAESAAYDVGSARTTPEGEKARRATEFDMEQPDWPR